MFIVVVGNPVDGMRAYGPFEDPDKALGHGKLMKLGDDGAWVTRLLYPDTICEDCGEYH